MNRHALFLLLAISSVACLSVYVASLLRLRQEHQSLRAWLERRGAPASVSAATGKAAEEQAPPSGEPMGVLRIPRLNLEAAVFSGVADTTLGRGAGWIPGTALPGRAGNAGIAAHRDTLFRPLRHIKVGDEVEWMGPAGRHRYRVVWTRIVEPSEVSVLDGTARPALTLVSCYPFFFVGSAPKRFIVRAEREPERR